MGFFDAYGAVIFDLDGTLIDSMPLWMGMCSDWLRSLNKIPLETLEDDILSMTLAESAAYINRNYCLDFSMEELISQWEEIMIRRYLEGAPLKKGAGELAAALWRHGKKLGIATYSFPRACEAILSRHGILQYFSVFLYAQEAEDFSVCGSVKKDGQFWRFMAARLGMAPENCLVFEDSYSSLEGVRAAGMGMAAVFDASSKKWALLSKAADLAVQYPGEALQYL